MTPVQFPRANRLATPFAAEFEAAPVAVTPPMLVTVWKPSDLELTRLLNGGLVTLSIYGEAQPPVILGVARPVDLEMSSAAAG